MKKTAGELQPMQPIIQPLCAVLLFITVLVISLVRSGNATDGAVDKSLVWDKYTTVYFLCPESGTIRNKFTDNFSYATNGVILIGRSDTEEKQEHEIVVGERSREISRLAYDAFYEGMPSDISDVEGYLIYVYDGSVALAYSSESAFSHALDAFTEKCVFPSFEAEEGVFYSHYYSKTERANEERLSQYATRLEKIKKSLTDKGYDNAEEITAAIEKLYSLYDSDMLLWLASLYDKDIGGFYYSASGRDNLGYFPDLESTVQIFSMLDRAGMYSAFGGISNLGIEGELGEQILAWARSLQSSEDGYFYHPQWGKNIGVSRRGRDLDNAYTLFSYLKSNPYYTDPTGRLGGIYGKPGESAVKPAAYLTSPLGAGVDFSAVMPTASTLPEYLWSLEAFEAYLIKLNVSKNSYSAGNALASDASLIKAAGKEYCKLVINYLNDIQIPETGLWEYNTPDDDYDPTDGIGYNGVNGLMKISVLYSTLGYALPNAYNALQSTIKVGLYPNIDPQDETVCYVLNIWTCLNQTLSNVKSKDKSNYPAARALLMANAPALIESSYDLLKTHVMPDGGFAYYERQPMNISQGAVVGCAEGPESDINATAVATTSTVTALFAALGISKIPIWYLDDYYVFMDAIGASDSIVKDPKAGVETFENYTDESGVNINIHSGASSEIITDATSLNGGKVLKLSTSAGSASLTVDMRNASDDWVYECSFLEADFLVESAEVGEVMRFSQMAGNQEFASFSLERYESEGVKYLRLVDTFPGVGGVISVIKDEITLGEWHRIRIMTHKTVSSTSGKVTVRNKINIDDEFVMMTDSAWTDGGVVVNMSLDSAKIEVGLSGATTVLLDNLLSEMKDVPFS